MASKSPRAGQGQGSGAPRTTAARKAPRQDIAVFETFDFPPCNNTALRRAARRLGNLYDDALESVGLKATQMGLMAEIARMTAADQGRSPSLQELATALAIQISALTHALRPLVRDGLVAVLPDEDDGRTKRGALTVAGAKRLEEASACWAAANQRVEAVLGRDDAATLRALADRVSSDDFLAAFTDKPLAP